MSKPREFWVDELDAFDSDGIEHTSYVAYCREHEGVHVIEKSAYDRAIEAQLRYSLRAAELREKVDKLVAALEKIKSKSKENE